MSELIFGKNTTEKIVAIEAVEDEILILTKDGTEIVLPKTHWVLAPFKLGSDFSKLEGSQWYKYITELDSSKFRPTTQRLRRAGNDFYTVWNPVENFMIRHGYTMFKGMNFNQLKVISFDIESAGIAKDETAEVFVITASYKDEFKRFKKQFVKSDDETSADVLDRLCDWVYEMDPDILTGHNILGYDIPYMDFCYQKHRDSSLPLGRDGSPISFAKNPSEKRVDGTQTWTYHKIKCFGRQVIDGMFLAVMYDIGRNYPSWGLKAIAEYEGWVTEDRQFYDASKIGDNWYVPEERKKIIKYCEDDSEDSMRVFELMAPSFFYMCQSIPKTFQGVIESASGSWLNSIMVRSYLQMDYSIPKKDEPSKVHGGISFGLPGVYKNMFKIDLASLYPSIIRAYSLYSKKKDPLKHYLTLTNVFTEERLKNKKIYKETKDKYYDDLQASQKVFINSLFGLCGTNGLNFNDFALADRITGYGRQILKATIKWATGKNIQHWWKDYESDKDQKYEGLIDKI